MTVMTQCDVSALPKEHLDLEAKIRNLQALAGPSIPEERLQPIIADVSQGVFRSLIAAAQLRPLLRTEALDVAATMITSDKDRQQGLTGTDAEVVRVVQKLGETRIGQEALFRVIHTISSLFVQKTITFPGSTPSLSQVHQATTLFAAQPLLARLRGEEAYT